VIFQICIYSLSVGVSVRHLQVLAATKCDLSDERVVSQTEGEDLGHRYGYPIFECSAKTEVNIDRVFETILRMLMQNRSPKSKESDKKGGKCVLQ
jgi:GTPase SAR1 family protein